MKKTAVGVCALAFATCAQALFDDKLPPEAYLDPIDQQIARTGVGIPGRPYPCSRDAVEAGVKVIVHSPAKQCVKMLPAQRWRGLWRNDFHGSRFCPAPATECKFDSAGDRIWLSYRPDKGTDSKLYRVDFIGRRTVFKGPYGHLGASDHEILVDRMIMYGEVSE